MLRLGMILILALGWVSCDKQAPPEDVERAANRFFEQIKEADYERIYNESAQALREQNAKAKVFDDLKQITAFGTIRQIERLSMTMDREGEHQVALPVYSVLFEQARCEVTLKFTDDDGDWKLLGFAVRRFPGF
jgi:hypothetical protein